MNKTVDPRFENRALGTTDHRKGDLAPFANPFMQRNRDPHIQVERDLVGGQTKEVVDLRGGLLQAGETLFFCQTFPGPFDLTEIQRNGSYCGFHGLLREPRPKTPLAREQFLSSPLYFSIEVTSLVSIYTVRYTYVIIGHIL